ncbi:hypothetical protein IGI04_011305 [Brassica rapa subsp. trilocularis]|uniref:PPM-type phosphatase domain-containing protein n=1 Tax=Brassica rapa subsp. trilocularis TaxID=1813537 RepID=A0ABQ7N4U4_BRACM|nr:hypothetical protein IGI04_011305 [Brassica rapa subsp. trilocularis]
MANSFNILADLKTGTSLQHLLIRVHPLDHSLTFMTGLEYMISDPTAIVPTIDAKNQNDLLRQSPQWYTIFHTTSLSANLALAKDTTIFSDFSSGTSALAALIFGRHLMVANAGDGKAVLCRNGEAIDMSQDHTPIYLP